MAILVLLKLLIFPFQNSIFLINFNNPLSHCAGNDFVTEIADDDSLLLTEKENYLCKKQQKFLIL